MLGILLAARYISFLLRMSDIFGGCGTVGSDGPGSMAALGPVERPGGAKIPDGPSNGGPIRADGRDILGVEGI